MSNFLSRSRFELATYAHLCHIHDESNESTKHDADGAVHGAGESSNRLHDTKTFIFQ
jgi:hypothetical protein